MADERYLSIAIQDPEVFIAVGTRRNTRVKPVALHLVRRVEEEYSTSSFGLRGIPSGKFAFFNRSIQEELRSGKHLVRGLEVKLAGDGYGYLVGGYIESEFILTPTDQTRVAEGFPLAGVDPGNLRMTTTYAKPPDSWRKSSNPYEKRKYDEGWMQVRVGINTDVQGNLQTEEQVIQEQEQRGFFGGKKTVKVPVRVSRLIPLPENETEASEVVLQDIIKVCQVIEAGVNSLHKYTRRIGEPLGEVHLAVVYPNNRSQILFASEGGEETLAKSYSVSDKNGTRIYEHFFRLEVGEIKVRQSVDEPATGQDTGTKTIDRPREKPVEKAPSKPLIKPVPEQSKAAPKNGDTPRVVTLDDIIGAADAKKELMRVCDYFKNAAEYRKWGISQKAGALLYGPPGTGKTLLARALANEARAEFIVYKSTEVKTKWSGESQLNLGKLLEDAKKHERAILLFDEFDALARKRELSDGSSHGTEAELVTILLQFLDGFDRQDNVYLIGTTNRKDVIDDAVLQRLYPIEVPLPDLPSRGELVRRRITKHTTTAQINPFGDTDFQAIAQASEGLSGRDLVGEKQGIFLTLLHKAKELTDQNGGQLYVVSTQDWLDEIKKLKGNPKRGIGF